MGWNINMLENTVVVPQEYAERLYEAGRNSHFFGDVGDVLNQDGTLTFDPDAMEHMDYLLDQDILTVLKDARVNGRVVFCDTEGDNRGTYCTYTFTDGAVAKNEGKLVDLIA